MATPIYGECIAQARNGERRSYRVYLSDAAGAVTWPDGSSEINFSSNDVYLVDFICAAMATMVSLTFYVAGQPVRVIGATTQASTVVNGRSIQQAPLLIPGGASLRIVQA